jgi:hypothetical protein
MRIGVCLSRNFDFSPSIDGQHGVNTTCAWILQFDAITKRALWDTHVSASVLKLEVIN